MVSTLSELQSKLYEERQASHSIETIIEGMKREIKKRYQALIDSECDAIDTDYRETRQAAASRVRNAEQAYNAAKIASMADAKLGGVPIGGRVVQWDRHYSHSPYRKTGKVGVIELCTKDSQFPSNKSYGLPSIGSLFIRVLKKNGEPSLNFEWRYSLDSRLPWGWYPESMIPNE